MAVGVTKGSGSMTSGSGRAAPTLAPSNQQAIRDDWKKVLAQTTAKVTGGKLSKKEGLQVLTDFQDKYNPEGGDTWLSNEMGYAQPWADEVAAETKTAKLKEEDKKATEEILSKFETTMGKVTQGLEEAKKRGMAEVTAGEGAAATQLEKSYKDAKGFLATGVTEEQKALTDITGEGGIISKAKGEAGAALESARGALAPWKAAGEGALSKFQQAMGLAEGGGDLGSVLSNLPGFQFRLEQGLGAVSKMQAARGGVLGGRALQELQQVGQGVASEEFGRYLGGLSDLMGRGQAASGAISGLYAQEGSLAAGFAEMATGATERSAQRLSGLRMTQAGMAEQEGMNLANLRTSSAMARANMEVGVGQAAAGIATGTATGAMQLRAATQQQGTGMEFQNMMTSWTNNFNERMAKWEASTMESISKSNANQQLFTTLLGGAMQIGGAFAGKP